MNAYNTYIKGALFMENEKIYHNNHLQKTTATKADISRLSKHALALFEMKTPDLHDPEQVYETIKNYFIDCDVRHIRPGNMGLYAVLGITRQDYNNMCNGKLKSKISPVCMDIVKKAVRAISAYREDLASEGKLHPTTYIFMAKNYDQMEDYTKIELSADTGSAANLTPEQVQKQIEQDIPIDTDYTEK